LRISTTRGRIIQRRPKAVMLVRFDEDDPSHDLYFKLSGNDKPDEFDAAIESFKSQFNISLTFVEKNDFLDVTFDSDGGPPRSDDFSLLTRPCEVRFGCSLLGVQVAEDHPRAVCVF